jgi:hypothetical protein
MTLFTQGDNTGGGTIPADPHGAAGTVSLIAVTNTQIECIRKDGTAVFGPTPLATMFSGFTPVRLTDPKVVYDTHADRFIVVVLDLSIVSGTITGSRIFVAVSKNGNPITSTSTDWFFLQINGTVGGLWADYPGIAVDEEAV